MVMGASLLLLSVVVAIAVFWFTLTEFRAATSIATPLDESNAKRQSLKMPAMGGGGLDVRRPNAGGVQVVNEEVDLTEVRSASSIASAAPSFELRDLGRSSRSSGSSPPPSSTAERECHVKIDGTDDVSSSAGRSDQRETVIENEARASMSDTLRLSRFADDDDFEQGQDGAPSTSVMQNPMMMMMTSNSRRNIVSEQSSHSPAL